MDTGFVVITYEGEQYLISTNRLKTSDLDRLKGVWFLLNAPGTLRSTGREIGIPHTTFWYWLHHRFKDYIAPDDLYEKVVERLELNWLKKGGET